MSTTYNTRPGDTFESISRIATGTERNTSQIKKANPGVLEPIPAGTKVFIPSASQLTSLKQEAPQGVAVFIDGQRFRFWLNVTLSFDFASMRTASFTAPFDPEDPAQRETFRPYSYKQVEVFVNGNLEFTGVIINIAPDDTEGDLTVSVTCYSLPAVLNDVTPPISAFPLEFKSQNLRSIVSSLASPFNIGVVYDAAESNIFKKVAIRPTEKILPFLIRLAKQRGLFITDNSEGFLVISDHAPPASAGALSTGVPPLVAIRPAFNEQNAYAQLTGISLTKLRKLGESSTVKNDLIPEVLRTINVELNDAEASDVKTGAEAAMRRLQLSSVTYSAELATWVSPSGDIWRVNDSVSVTAPPAMIYSETKLQVQRVTLFTDSNEQRTTLELGLLDAVAPWQE